MKKTVSPEFFRSKSPSAVSKIPTYPHKLFPLKIPTFCQIIPTFFINPHNFKKKSQHFWKFGYKFFEYFRKIEVFFKISIAYLKFRSPLEKNDPHWAPENPHIGDKSPILETLWISLFVYIFNFSQAAKQQSTQASALDFSPALPPHWLAGFFPRALKLQKSREPHCYQVWLL